jgi:hypothetical protein
MAEGQGTPIVIGGGGGSGDTLLILVVLAAVAWFIWTKRKPAPIAVAGEPPANRPAGKPRPVIARPVDAGGASLLASAPSPSRCPPGQTWYPEANRGHGGCQAPPDSTLLATIFGTPPEQKPPPVTAPPGAIASPPVVTAPITSGKVYQQVGSPVSVAMSVMQPDQKPAPLPAPVAPAMKVSLPPSMPLVSVAVPKPALAASSLRSVAASKPAPMVLAR